MAVTFHNEGNHYILRNKRLIRQWINDEIGRHSKTPGDIAVILCTDEFLGAMNQKYLGHDTLTDIITFDYCYGKLVSGDIFISIDRIIENAGKYDVNRTEELKRVIIHGILHLLGFNDETPLQKERIHKLEDQALKNFPIA